jgi:hypothetical protein
MSAEQLGIYSSLPFNATMNITVGHVVFIQERQSLVVYRSTAGGETLTPMLGGGLKYTKCGKVYASTTDYCRQHGLQPAKVIIANGDITGAAVDHHHGLTLLFGEIWKDDVVCGWFILTNLMHNRFEPTRIRLKLKFAGFEGALGWYGTKSATTFTNEAEWRKHIWFANKVTNSRLITYESFLKSKMFEFPSFLDHLMSPNLPKSMPEIGDQSVWEEFRFC